MNDALSPLRWFMVFCHAYLEHLVVEPQIGDDRLEPSVLFAELPQFPTLRSFPLASCSLRIAAICVSLNRDFLREASLRGDLLTLLG
jgi:hypothetical protein